MPSGAAQLEPHWYTEQSQDTLFDRLNSVGRKWAVYYYDFPSSLVFPNLRKPHNLQNYRKVDAFFAEAAADAANFPEFVFIEPQYFGVAQNDDHPPHNVMKAEKLIADVYNALRSNTPLWEKTLLVVVYDEHGGFYDHVVPPQTIAPDDLTQAYEFNQFGVRVPALLISPKCEARVEHTLFDHTSLLRYLSDKWGFEPLGRRAAQANSIGVALKPGLNRQGTIPFVRVTNASLISQDVDAEKDAQNLNQTALHHLADFIYQGLDHGMGNALQAAADVERTAGGWTKFKHWLGARLREAGAALSADMRDKREARNKRTSDAVQVLRSN